MKLAVNPNRMELLRLKKRVVLAERGHKLLRDKQEELMRRFLALFEEARRLRQETDEKLRQAFSHLLYARAQMGDREWRLAASRPRQLPKLICSEKRVMNLKLASFRLEGEFDPFNYGLAETSAGLDLGLKLLAETMPALVRLAETEKAVEMMAEEIERTRRRVNALEHILIPSLAETIKYITMKLNEIERSNLVRLMRVKEMMEVETGS